MSSILSRGVFRHLVKGTRASGSSAVGREGGEEMWKKLTLFLAVPCVIVMTVSTYLAHAAEGHDRPDFVPYEYLYVHNKKWPWRDGVKTLFHNPHKNALPTGYEDEH